MVSNNNTNTYEAGKQGDSNNDDDNVEQQRTWSTARRSLAAASQPLTEVAGYPSRDSSRVIAPSKSPLFMAVSAASNNRCVDVICPKPTHQNTPQQSNHVVDNGKAK